MTPVLLAACPHRSLPLQNAPEEMGCHHDAPEGQQPGAGLQAYAKIDLAGRSRAEGAAADPGAAQHNGDTPPNPRHSGRQEWRQAMLSAGSSCAMTGTGIGGSTSSQRHRRSEWLTTRVQTHLQGQRSEF